MIFCFVNWPKTPDIEFIRINKEAVAAIKKQVWDEDEEEVIATVGGQS